MSTIKLNSSSNIPSKYLPSVVLQKLDIPKDSIVYVIKSETSEKNKREVAQSKKDLVVRNRKNLKSNHEGRHKILSIEYICQRCHQSFDSTESHRQHVLSHYNSEKRRSSEDSDSLPERSRSKRQMKTHIPSHPYHSFCQIAGC